jgi:hypothetical protein
MSWIEELQGLKTVLDEAGDPVERRQTIQFIGADVTDDGEKTVVDITRTGAATPESITGDATPATVAELKQAVDSIIAALVARGIATDDRA